MIILLFFCIGIVSGGGGYGPSPARYGPIPYYYNSYSSEEHKRDIRKLSDLDGTKIFKADIKYFISKYDDYAVISCKSNSTYFTWIMTQSDSQTIHGIDNEVPYTLPLAGGANATYLAKYGRDGKWHGEDLLYFEKRAFRRVGCYQSNNQETVIVRVN